MESFMEAVAFEGEVGIKAEEHPLQEGSRARQGLRGCWKGGVSSMGWQILWLNGVAIIAPMPLELSPHRGTPQRPPVFSTLSFTLNELPSTKVIYFTDNFQVPQIWLADSLSVPAIWAVIRIWREDL